jgi:hypothetical protein
VSGGTGNPTPTGYANAIGGGSIFRGVLLNNGSATVIVPGGSLRAGVNTLTVNYQPDSTSAAIYNSASSTASVNVTMAPLAATPTFSPTAGTYSSGQTVMMSDATPGATIYYTTDGSDPTTFASTVYSSPIVVSSSETIKAIAAASGYSNSFIGAAVYSLPSQVPVLGGLSPAFASAGSPAFTFTVTGSGFSAGSTVYWGTTALTTQFGSATQLTANVPASSIAAAGTASVTVQTPAPGGGTSNTLQFQIDSSTGSANAPSFGTATATITPGSTASYKVTLPPSATNASATCLNLPSGATCSYSATSDTVTIATLPTTPMGTYQITVVFTETESAAATALVLFPILLLPVILIREKLGIQERLGSGRAWFTAFSGLILLAAATCIGACGGNSGTAPTSPSSATQQVTSSAIVTLTIQ